MDYRELLLKYLYMIQDRDYDFLDSELDTGARHITKEEWQELLKLRDEAYGKYQPLYDPR